MKPYIVCSGANGQCVVFGYSETEPEVGKPHRLERARMVIYWPEACNGLLGLAAAGPKPGLRLTPEVSFVKDMTVEVVGVSELAAAGLSSWR